MVAKVTIKDILSPGSNIGKRFVKNHKDLDRLVNDFKRNGYRIVLTQGVYDLVHQGHAAYLEAAKALGDILIVGVDSDELTRKRKGPGRPIVPEDERLRMLVHLRHVDVVTIKGVKQGIGDIIRLVRPDVFVVSKSTKDFTDKLVKEYAPFCKKIVSLPPQATTSTSARIRVLTMDGAEQLAGEIGRLTQEFLNRVRRT